MIDLSILQECFDEADEYNKRVLLVVGSVEEMDQIRTVLHVLQRHHGYKRNEASFYYGDEGQIKIVSMGRRQHLSDFANWQGIVKIHNPEHMYPDHHDQWLKLKKERHLAGLMKRKSGD